MNKKYILISILSIAALLISGCSSPGSNAGPTFTNVNVPDVAAANAPYIISAETDQEADIEFDHDRGEFIYKTNTQADWRAPNSEGEAVITIKATNDKGEITLNEETVTVKQAPVKPTEDAFEVSIGSTNMFATITLENIDNKERTITSLKLNIVGWGEDGKRVTAAGSYVLENPSEPDTDGLKFPYNETKTFELKTNTLNKFDTTPAEVQAYVTWVEFEGDENNDWSLE